MTAQMFDDVSYTSTPFHKPHMSKKSQELNDTENANSMTSLKSKSSVKGENLSDVLVISSTNVIRKSPKVSKSRSASSSVTEVTLPKRRSSSRSNISRNGKFVINIILAYVKLIEYRTVVMGKLLNW